ncbi:metallophosphoesterase [Sulfurovum sp. zt1-1]|uniref:Metallophosphoesterase n=1 Tax=Sulfurovum zhangzhouensis TaxID=3019067 RepID=A0ABT7R076_9BACT|nr:metallophosphoesterase [Sulfurovum zhangzhouensis]MDM5272507.1 metallophosphoesterase [Sulfurovum zhangzhouensis]
MNILPFVAIFLGFFALISIYISRRLINHLHLSDQIKHYLRFFLLLNYAGIIGYMLARYFSDTPNWLYFLLSLPIGILFLLFCTAVFYDIFRVGMLGIPMQPQRRDFLKKSLDIGALGVAFGVSADATYQARIVKLEEVPVKIKNLARPYTIAQISDTHVGGLINKKFMQNVVNRVNALEPDLVVITGDLVDVKLSQAQKALEALRGLKSTYGTYFIVGNHEYFHGIEEIIAYVKSIGIRVLENENIYIGEKGEGFNLAGVYDVFGYRIEQYKPDIHFALQGIEQDSPTILLAHQPRFVEEADGKVDLMLSGHTHGGQLYPFKALVRLQQPYVSGLHRHSDKTQVYVNKGTGFWGPPMRLGASSEITCLKLIKG